MSFYMMYVKSRRLVTVGDDLMIESNFATRHDATSIEWTDRTAKNRRFHARDPAERKRRVVFVAVSLPRRVL